MTYIPVGTFLTYTAQVTVYLTTGYTSWQDLIAQLKNDLPNLPGMEELDVSAANGSSSILDPRHFSISLQILNNGVDHGNETDIQSIIDGTIQGYGNAVVSSNITSIKLPDNPEINTGATSNAPPPITPTNSGGILDSLGLSNISTGTKLLTSGTIIIIILIIVVLLLPTNARKLVGG